MSICAPGMFFLQQLRTLRGPARCPSLDDTENAGKPSSWHIGGPIGAQSQTVRLVRTNLCYASHKAGSAQVGTLCAADLVLHEPPFRSSSTPCSVALPPLRLAWARLVPLGSMYTRSTAPHAVGTHGQQPLVPVNQGLLNWTICRATT